MENWRHSLILEPVLNLTGVLGSFTNDMNHSKQVNGKVVQKCYLPATFFRRMGWTKLRRDSPFTLPIDLVFRERETADGKLDAKTDSDFGEVGVSRPLRVVDRERSARLSILDNADVDVMRENVPS